MNKIKNTWSMINKTDSDPILGLSISYNSDTFSKKVNLGVGAYRTNEGKPYVLECVKIAQEKNIGENIEYAPIDGLPEFIKAAQILAFGNDNDLHERTATVQTLSGTGSLRVGAEFIAVCNEIINTNSKENLKRNTMVYLPNPTWPNHYKIMSHANLLYGSYNYYDTNSNDINFDLMINDIYQMEPGSVIIFHACAHNPTGTDPTNEQWKQLSHACTEKDHIVWFDSAYQGFSSGDPNIDSESYKIFIRDGHSIILSQSFSKNMGLYGMRTGALHVVTANLEEKLNVIEMLKSIIRPMYSSPPIDGARIVSRIVNDPLLYKLWISELKIMSDRIKEMRVQLREKLKAIGSSRDWSHITKQIGMFSYTRLEPNQVNILINKYHIYMTGDGRISMAGINSANIDYVTECIHNVTK